MNLYLISQDINNDYDTFDSAVVCAPDEETARNTHPQGIWGHKKRYEWDKWSWCPLVSQVKVKLIGKAVEGMEHHVVCASFHAG